MTASLTLTETLEQIIRSAGYLGPELLLVSGLVVLIIADLFVPRESNKVLNWLALFTTLFCLAFCLVQFKRLPAEGLELFGGLLMLDQTAVFFKVICSLGGFLSVLMQMGIRRDKGQGEFLSLLLTLVLATLFMSMSRHLLSVYISIELASIVSYALAGFRFNKGSAEASLKYILFGALSSAVMLYGFSWLYGLTGTLDLANPAFVQGLEAASLPMLTVALVLSLAGLFFKISLFPFHIWTPDVYEGAPTPVVALFSVTPKLAAIMILARLMQALNYSWAQPDLIGLPLQSILTIAAIISMLIGNFSALLQNNPKRMMAYSAIAHSGFLVAGLAAGNAFGFRAILYYGLVYLFMNFGAFFFLYIAEKRHGITHMYQFKGLGRQAILPAICVLVIMVSLTGLPPTGGFTAKLFLFSAIWEAFSREGSPLLLSLFVFGLLNTIVSLFYYLKIPYYLFFKEKADNTPTLKYNTIDRLFLLLATIMLLALFFGSHWLMQWVNIVTFVKG